MLVRTDSGTSSFTMMSARRVREPFVVANYLRYGLTERDVLLYKEVFDMMDPKDRGYISPNDLKAGLLSIGIHLSRADLYNLVCDYDNEEGGVLSFEDFLRAITGEARPCDEDNKEDYKRVFSKLAGNKTHISQEDLLKNMRSIGMQMSDEDFERLYEKLGVTDGLITFEVFYDAMMNFIYGDHQSNSHSSDDEVEFPLKNKPKSETFSPEKSQAKRISFMEPKQPKTSDVQKEFSRSKTFKK